MSGSPEPLDSDALADLGGIVTARTGLHFAPERRGDLERGVRAAAPALGFEDAAACLQWLVSAPLSRHHLETLASHLTIGETYFFRDKHAFETLQTHILPELIAARRHGTRSLRLWSAGCCTGEEPYSLAIALDRILPDAAKWHVSILATDINPQFLRKAKEGIYREWSFRDVPSWIKTRYFQPVANGRYQIAEHIRRMVTFAPLNLVADEYPSLAPNTQALDVIVCRNVLIYFALPQIQKIVDGFNRCLSDGGWLWMAASETSYALPLFTPLDLGSVWFRKSALPLAPGTAWDEASAAGAAALEPTPLEPTPLEPTSLPDMTAPQAAAPSESAANASATLNDALALYNRGDYVHAAHKLETVVESQVPDEGAELAPLPSSIVPSLTLLARSWINAGQRDRALACCDEALVADKMNASLHLLRATVLQEDGNVTGAVAALRRALYLDHDLVLAHFALGQLLGEQGRTADASRHFDTASQLLRRYDDDEVLPGSEDVTAGHLAGIIAVLKSEGKGRTQAD